MPTIEHICGSCRFACPPPARGKCACSIDGQDILVHIRAKECPKGFYAGAAETPTRPENAGPPPPPPEPVRFAEWSFAARYLARKRIDGEVGIGDTFKRLLGAGGRMIEWVAKRLDIDCGCSSRQARWNATHPYSELPIK